MPNLPRLNQTFDLATIIKDKYGDEQKANVVYNIPCRYNTKKGRKEENGRWIDFDIALHTTYEEVIEAGNAITIDGRNYAVQYVEATPDLDGNFFKQYVLAKEYYYD